MFRRAFSSVWSSFARSGGVFTARLLSLPVVARRLEQVTWSNCPEISASVESVSVASVERRWHPHLGCVIYHYRVGDKNYSGLFTRAFPTNQEAWEFVAECRARPVSVRYRPEDPAQSHMFERPRRPQQSNAA